MTCTSPVEVTPIARCAAIVIELIVAIFAVRLFFHAKREGWRWVSTLFTGMVFGWAAETIIVHGQHGTIFYRYCGDVLPGKLLEVPIVIGIGWGSILYATTWTAQRLDIPVWLRPFAAALLAINIDLSLDPVASTLGFWTWFKSVNGEEILLSKIVDRPPDYYGVPYDNFLGWFLIIATYTASVRALFAFYDKRKAAAETVTNPAQPLNDQPRSKLVRPWKGSGAGRYGNPADRADWIIPPIGGAISLVLMAVLKSKPVPTLYQNVDPSIIFILALPIVALLSWRYATKANRHQAPSWPIILMPVVYHGFALALLLIIILAGDASFNTLCVAVSFNALAGFIGFAWPSLAVLFPTSQEDALRRGVAAASDKSTKPVAASSEKATSTTAGVTGTGQEGMPATPGGAAASIAIDPSRL